MKTNFKKRTLIRFAIIGLVLFASCTKETSEEVSPDEIITATELKTSDESTFVSEEIFQIIEDVYATEEIQVQSKNYNSNLLPDCVTITTAITGTSKQKTIDFGSGCTLPNGNTLSGIIMMTYEQHLEMASKTIAVSLDNFSFNEVGVEGNANINRMRSNENGVPQSNAVLNFTISWLDGSITSFSGEQTREWILGYGSGYWADNVFLITRKGSYTGRQGNVFTKTTTTPIRREAACRFIVSGVLEITRNDSAVRLDFGNGECDAKGLLTLPNGTTEEIFLRRFK